MSHLILFTTLPVCTSVHGPSIDASRVPEGNLGFLPLEMYVVNLNYSLDETCISTCSFAYGEMTLLLFWSLFLSVSFSPGQRQGQQLQQQLLLQLRLIYNWPMQVCISTGSSLLELRLSVTLLIIRSVHLEQPWFSLCYKCLRFLWPFNDSWTQQWRARKQMPNHFGVNQPHRSYNWYSPSHLHKLNDL